MKKNTLFILLIICALLFSSCAQKPSNSEISSLNESSMITSSDVSSESMSESMDTSSEASAEESVISSSISSSTVKSESSSKSSASSQASSSAASSQAPVVDDILLNTMNAAQLDAIKKETNILRWDIAWAPTPIEEFFDFYDNASPAVAIWKGIKNADSVFENGDWGLVMHAIKASDSVDPALLIYNKTDIPSNAKNLQVIARSNPLSHLLSGRGAFRIKVAYKVNGKYKVENLKVIFTDNQIAQTSADFKQGADGYVTFEAPPKSDKSDAFQFDVSKILGKKDVVFFVEVNDRMDTSGDGGVNLPDRVIIAAIRFIY